MLDPSCRLVLLKSSHFQICMLLLASYELRERKWGKVLGRKQNNTLSLSIIHRETVDLKHWFFFFFWLSNNPLFYWKKVLEKKEKAKDKNREEREKGWEREKGKEEKGKSFWCVKNSYDLVLKPFLVSSGHHHHCLYTYSLYLLRRPLSLVTETQRERERFRKKNFLGFLGFQFLAFLSVFWFFWSCLLCGFFEKIRRRVFFFFLC